MEGSGSGSGGTGDGITRCLPDKRENANKQVKSGLRRWLEVHDEAKREEEGRG